MFTLDRIGCSRCAGIAVRLRPEYAARTVLLTQAARKVLNGHPTRFRNEYIFLNTQGGPCLDADAFNTAWKAALMAAGVDYRIAYNCRHTYASLALTAGVNPAFIANQLGHGLDMTLTIYGKYINSENDKLELAKIEEQGKK
ncbi:tyrosine-type recombinase/integrase [Exilibacterium tricleocarpae]|uniref:tyrosine-type recombinase/integrase n=1 Tax=Exilibacterium tricleocarpae TaxID=2591008 RepID=UPI0024824FA0|nr:site-specific integrase [Exilibacterium tricleocarpae]